MTWFVRIEVQKPRLESTVGDEVQGYSGSRLMRPLGHQRRRKHGALHNAGGERERGWGRRRGGGGRGKKQSGKGVKIVGRGERD
eukprot:1428953-Pleurochrysis_carterae.AAC.5